MYLPRDGMGWMRLDTMAKKNRNIPVHSMASEPEVSLRDIVVDDIAAAKLADELRDEIEAEYDVIGSEPIVAALGEVDPAVYPTAYQVHHGNLLAAPEVGEDLSGAAQDELVADIDELKEMVQMAQADLPKECPTCHRPFVATTVGKDGEETKSSKIRKLAAAGMSKGEIGRTLGISYQFVHNVLGRAATKAT